MGADVEFRKFLYVQRRQGDLHQMKRGPGHKLSWKCWELSIRVILKKKYCPEKYFSNCGLGSPLSMSTQELTKTKEQSKTDSWTPTSDLWTICNLQKWCLRNFKMVLLWEIRIMVFTVLFCFLIVDFLFCFVFLIFLNHKRTPYL